MGYWGGAVHSPTYGAHALLLSLKYADTDISLTNMTGSICNCGTGRSEMSGFFSRPMTALMQCTDVKASKGMVS